MKNDFDQWLDFDSSSNHLNNSQHIHTPIRPDNDWQNILKPEQKLVLNESIEIFPSVKRKYQEKFTKAEQLTSSSPLEDDELSQSLNSNNIGKPHLKASVSTKSQTQHIRKLQQQNRYLKQKVDDLSFRLRQTQLQLNKLKYSGNNNIANFESMKQNYLKQITELMKNHRGHEHQTCEVFRKLRQLTDFDGKLKVDLMNYFMSELLENIINDSTFYYLDSILKKKGLWKEAESDGLRKVDEQVIEIAQLQKANILRDFKMDLKQSISIPGQKYKDCWKSFYRSYIALLNQGFVLQNFLRLAMGKILTYIDKQKIGKVEIHFQKIKLRKDIRVLRQSWFREIQYDEENEKQDQRQGVKKHKY